MYYRVIPFEQSFDSYGLIYKVPEVYRKYELIGTIGEFPFWKKILRWLIAESLDISVAESLSYEVRELLWLISESPLLTEKEIEMIDFIAKHYFCQIHLALRLYLSTHLLQDLSTLKYFSRKSGSYRYSSQDIHLNCSQNKVYSEIKNLPDRSISMLYGVTWSGKTHIYIKLIEEALRLWCQSLLLIPEIILTSQIGEKLQNHFWDQVIVIHSGISPVKKIQYFKDIAAWDAKIIIGTRSALFYPYKNLQTIIIDEEHDRSYISDTAPRYHTKTLAKKMCELYNCSLLLGSWTPNIESFYKGLSWEYHLFQLLESYKK